MHTFYSCLTFVGGQSWPYYIGSKKENSKFVRTDQFCTLFPEGGVVWKSLIDKGNWLR